MKKLSFLVAALCATMFASAATKTSTFTDKDWTVGDGEPAWAATGASANSFEASGSARGVQVTLTSIASDGLSLTCSSFSETITGVSLVLSSNKANADDVISVGVKVGTKDFLSDSEAQVVIAKSNNATYEFTGSATGSIVVSFTTALTSKSMYVKSITVTYASAGVEDPEFSVAEGIYAAAQSVELSCTTEGAKIYYTLDESEPSESSTEYTAAIAVEETTTIKAIAVKGGDKSEIKSATYTILHLDGEGTEENPFTCADVMALANSLGTAQEYWVMGYIIGGVKSQDNALVTDNTVVSAIGLADAKGVENPDIAVQLENSSSARTALNVVDNSGVIGKKVKVKGTLENYCNNPGVKGVGAAADYVIIDEPVTAIESVEVSNIYGVNGTIYGAEGARIYTITGMDVTEQNGALNGAYIVRMGDKAVKVIVK